MLNTKTTPGVLGVAADDSGVFRAMRDDATAATDDDDDELVPRAKFNNGVTTCTTQTYHLLNCDCTLSVTLINITIYSHYHCLSRLID